MSSPVQFRKYTLHETPLIYHKNPSELPGWKQYLLKHGHFILDGTVENQKKHEEIFKHGKEAVRADTELSLRKIKHTWHPEENSITISREQELKNNAADIRLFEYDEWNIKTMYIEKETGEECWSYFLDQEFDNDGTPKRVERIQNLATGLCYTYVNADFLPVHRPPEPMTINGTVYPAYANVHVHGSTFFINNSIPLYYDECDFICEHGGQLLYYCVGTYERRKHPCSFRKPVLKSIEYQENGKNYSLDFSCAPEASQIKKILKKLLKKEECSIIRITGGERHREVLLYGTAEKYFLAVRDDTGIRYARRHSLDTSSVQAFGLTIPQMCVVEYPVLIEDFIENIICSDYGYDLMYWVYFYENTIAIPFPEPDFSQAVRVEFPEAKVKKPQVLYTGFCCVLDHTTQSLDKKSLESMTSKKIYNLAVKKLKTGKLTYLSIAAVCGDEHEQNLLLYGDGTRFSAGILDLENDTALCYDNGSKNTDVMGPLGGQDFPGTMVVEDFQLVQDIIKYFCEQCLPLPSVDWHR